MQTYKKWYQKSLTPVTNKFSMTYSRHTKTTLVSSIFRTQLLTRVNVTCKFIEISRTKFSLIWRIGGLTIIRTTRESTLLSKDHLKINSQPIKRRSLIRTNVFVSFWLDLISTINHFYFTKATLRTGMEGELSVVKT